MEIYEQQTSLFGEEELTSLQEDSLASPLAPQENGEAPKMNATCGPKCLEQFERFNQIGSWAKTFSGLLIGRTDWYSSRCVLTWRLRATKYNRLLFRLQVSTLRTKGIEYGLSLIKTPTAMDGTVTSGKKNPVSGSSGTLAQEIMSQYQPTMSKLMLPTPTASDIEGGTSRDVKIKDGHYHRLNSNGVRWGVKLRDVVENNLLPTPLSQGLKTCKDGKTIFYDTGLLPTVLTGDYRTGMPNRGNNKGVKQINDMIASQNGIHSQLNPRFVAEMMGFPPDWTELPFQNGEKNQ